MKIELVNLCKSFKNDDWAAGSLDKLVPSGFLLKTYADLQSAVPNVGIKKRQFSIKNLNLAIPDCKIMVILGPSGCGKTTLLKIIAGLIKPDSGEIKFNGISVGNVHPKDRKVGMVFQNYALYPHLTSKTNILSYFFFHKKTPELDEMAKEKYKKTSELMGVDIEYLLDKKPTHLSGGEKQRVALGRCITRDPFIFLLDEPFSNLDQLLREKYRVNLKMLLNQFKITTIYVTHDQHEALILADIIAIMNEGKIEQIGTYEEIYNNPRNIFVSEFLNPNIETPAISFIYGEYISDELKEMIIGIHPKDIKVSKVKKENYIKGNIISARRIPVTDIYILNISIEKSNIYARSTSNEEFSANEHIWLYLKKYFIFDKKTGLRV